MRCNPARWLWGLIPIAMLSWSAFHREHAGIETELRGAALEAASAAGQKWAAIALDGRDATITGHATKDGEAKAALDAVRNIWGIRKVDLKTDLAAAEKLPPAIGPVVDAAAIEKAKRDAEAAATEKARQEAEARAAAEKARQEAEARAAAEKARQEAEARAAAEKARQEAEARAAAEKAREEAEARASAEKARQEAEAQSAAEKARQEAEAQSAASKAKQEADAKAAADQARQQQEAKAAAEKAKAESEARAAEAKAKQAADEDAAEKAKAEAAAKAPKTTNDTSRACEARLTEAARAGTILFERAKADIARESDLTIARLAEIVKSCPGTRVEVEGHTDSEGTPERNQGLSERRARAVVKSLVRAGAPTDRLAGIGYGAARPIAPNDTPANMAKNRRIEFKVFSAN